MKNTDGHAEDVAVMSRCINGIPDLITGSHSFVSDRTHPAHLFQSNNSLVYGSNYICCSFCSCMDSGATRRIGRDTLVNIKELNKYIVEEQERERYEKMNAKYLKEGRFKVQGVRSGFV